MSPCSTVVVCTDVTEELIAYIEGRNKEITFSWVSWGERKKEMHKQLLWVNLMEGDSGQSLNCRDSGSPQFMHTTVHKVQNFVAP